jgi:putative FmdB family regulatory protein
MPIYEYHCQSCGHTFEVLRKFSDPAIHECPRCSAQVQRLISLPALVFKGQGWYVNEFPSQDRKKGLDAEKGNGNGAKKKVEDLAKSSNKEEPKSESQKE